MGHLIDRNTCQRIKLPIRSEALISSTFTDCSFNSTLDETTFKKLNTLLNQRVQQLSTMKDYIGPKITHKHIKELDRFYKYKGGGYIRVAIDPQTQKMKRAIRKTRLQNLDFYCPHEQFDFRVSINLEEETEFPNEDDTPDHERSKDRLSYIFYPYQIDITVVKTTQMDNFGKPLRSFTRTYEVEMECNPDQFFIEKIKLDNKQENKFAEKVTCIVYFYNFLTIFFIALLNMVRTMINLCKTQQQPPILHQSIQKRKPQQKKRKLL